MNLYNCNTVDDCIEMEESLDLSHSKLFSKVIIDSGDKVLIANYLSIIDRYIDYIKQSLVTYKMTDEEFFKYMYKPKLFCMDMFGNMELWSLLLRVNNMSSVVYFKKKEIKIFDYSIIDVLNEIFILEKSNIEKNQEYIEKKLLEKGILTL